MLACLGHPGTVRGSTGHHLKSSVFVELRCFALCWSAFSVKLTDLGFCGVVYSALSV